MHKTGGDWEPPTPHSAGKDVIYDSGTIKVVVFACIIIVLAVVLTGGISYFITRNAVVDKLKTRDLVYTVDSITAKIDGRVERAKETSLSLATDPMIIEWVSEAEQDKLLSQYCKTKINTVAQNYDYANSFVVSAITNKYWAEGFKSIQVMSPDSPGDKWFYDALESGKAVDLNIDYNSGRKDTFVFINALVGDVHQPVGVAGVGLSLQSIAEEFRKYKFGEKSNLWLVDSKGKIHLSDDFNHNGRYLNDFVPLDVSSQVVDGMDNSSRTPKIIEYTNANDETVDLAYQQTSSTAWKVVFQIPRSESIAILGNIKLNTAIAGLVSLMLMIFVFYVVSNRIANPLKRALLITAEMEKQVKKRTRELVEKNQKIIDSIEYAQRLQESILATPEELKDVFSDYFILWKPRDIVGGDFYWMRRLDTKRCLLAVVDCTGHGVPGAFMTMAVNSVLKHIVDQGITEPASIIAEVNRRMKEILYRNNQAQITDDGLDIGICYIEQDKQLMYAGAKLSLYIYRENEVHILKGDRKSIGYRRSSNDLQFTNHVWTVEAGDKLYLTTDGYIDQNGGVKDYPFGKKMLGKVIQEQGKIGLSQQREAFEQVLNEYMGNESQRDDITMIGFSFK
ncbi:MAG: protein serine/threonine phosphatase [Sporomusa sp.]|nr:protein serine/threonine phosphatase [Sporomusa sp.]